MLPLYYRSRSSVALGRAVVTALLPSAGRDEGAIPAVIGGHYGAFVTPVRGGVVLRPYPLVGCYNPDPNMSQQLLFIHLFFYK